MHLDCIEKKEKKRNQKQKKGEGEEGGGMLVSDYNGSLLSWQPGGNLIG